MYGLKELLFRVLCILLALLWLVSRHPERIRPVPSLTVFGLLISWSWATSQLRCICEVWSVHFLNDHTAIPYPDLHLFAIAGHFVPMTALAFGVGWLAYYLRNVPFADSVPPAWLVAAGPPIVQLVYISF